MFTNEKEIKLSVMITFCNQKNFIKDAIESCLNQKYNFPIEILIGLDGEDAESENIIKNYMDKYDFIKLFKIDNSNLNTINIEKASNNRLNLLKHAIGDYICFLDGDDFYSDNLRFQTLVDFLDEHHEYIAVFHDLQIYDNKTQKIKQIQQFAEKSQEFEMKDFLKSHIQFSCFIYRNIFMQTVPPDLNTSFINDSTITLYMLRYGKFYYINRIMLSYRVGIDSIYNSLTKEKRFAYQLLAAEINHKTLSVADEFLCQKYKNLIKNVAKIFISKNDFLNDNEFKKIYNFAQKHSCYFTYSYLNYTKLNILEKIKLFIFTFIYCKYKNNLTIDKSKNIKLNYFNKRPNFGDELNLYILQRLLGLNVVKSSVEDCDLFAIGSILSLNFGPKPNFKFFEKKLKVWGTGFIMDKTIDKESFKRNVKVLALRGKYSQKRVEEIINKKLNVLLGDPGILAGKLIDYSRIKKKYALGIIPHYVDAKIDFKKNIKVNNYKIIDITQNPIFMLKEIAECETIFSSAMHGLIAADAMGIPNQWIELSDKVIGRGYKFIDYYSTFNIKPKAMNLLSEEITPKTIEELKKYYLELEIPKKIEEVSQNLLTASKKI